MKILFSYSSLDGITWWTLVNVNADAGEVEGARARFRAAPSAGEFTGDMHCYLTSIGHGWEAFLHSLNTSGRAVTVEAHAMGVCDADLGTSEVSADLRKRLDTLELLTKGRDAGQYDLVVSASPNSCSLLV